MNYILKLTFFLYIIAKLAVASNAGYMQVAILLVIIAASLFREKFGGYMLVFVLEGAAIYYGTTLDTTFSFLYGLLIYDLISNKYHLWAVPVLLLGAYTLGLRQLMDFLFIAGLCCVFAYMKDSLQAKEEMYRKSYDKQREYSYQLEQAKSRLQASYEETAHLAEIKERNRIARQIHDNVGHSIAGILMQLQAVKKLYHKDAVRSEELLGNSIETLSNTLTVMRDTVHNIKPLETFGVDYLKEIVDNFAYCPVDFRTSGDFGELSPGIMQILHYNLKEALTNISRYSKATNVVVRIDVNEKFVRLYIKDNGIGNPQYVEGLGISGMKERLRNIGGTFSISTDNGFLIVCMIPIKNKMEEEMK